MNLLVEDDSRLTRRVLAETLKGFGHDVTLAQDGQEALSLAAAATFDIVITDWEMPHMDGIELCWHIRAAQTTFYTYLILVTSSRNQDRHIEALDAGADDFMHKPLIPEVLHARIRTGGRIVSMQRELMALASTDPLTRALNRRAFLDRSAQEWDRARRAGHPVSVLMVDLDHFKHINDVHGHAAGDEALRRCVETCKQILRPFDLLGRFGGEEFAITLPGTTPEMAAVIAERLRLALKQVEITHGDRRFGLTASIGISGLVPGPRPVEDSLARADRALYQAKRKGRDRVEPASEDGDGA